MALFEEENLTRETPVVVYCSVGGFIFFNKCFRPNGSYTLIRI